MATKYTNEIKTSVLARYKSGEGPTVISRDLGIPKPTIWNWIRNPSPLQKPPSARWTKEEESFLSENYGNLTKDEILEQLPDKSKKSLTYKIEAMGLRKPEVKPVLDLCQPALLDFIRKTFKEDYMNQCSVREGKGKFAYLEYGNKTAEEFCKWIYEGASIYLRRKYEKAKGVIGGDLCVCS